MGDAGQNGGVWPGVSVDGFPQVRPTEMHLPLEMQMIIPEAGNGSSEASVVTQINQKEVYLRHLFPSVMMLVSSFCSGGVKYSHT